MDQNSCLAWSAAESDVHYKEICEKRLLKFCPNAMKTASHTPQKGKSSAYFPLLFLCWCDTLSWCIVRCHTFCHGRQKSPKQQALHFACWVLCVDRTMHRNFSGYYSSQTFWCIFLTRFANPGAHFQLFTSAPWFEMTEDRSHLTRKWHVRAGIELNAPTGQPV